MGEDLYRQVKWLEQELLDEEEASPMEPGWTVYEEEPPEEDMVYVSPQARKTAGGKTCLVAILELLLVLAAIGGCIKWLT